MTPPTIKIAIIRDIIVLVTTLRTTQTKLNDSHAKGFN